LLPPKSSSKKVAVSTRPAAALRKTKKSEKFTTAAPSVADQLKKSVTKKILTSGIKKGKQGWVNKYPHEKNLPITGHNKVRNQTYTLKNLKSKFLRSIVSYDFSLIKTKKTRNTTHTSLRLKTDENLVLDSLNLFTLRKNLKAFTRILLFSKRFKKTITTIYIQDNFLSSLLKNLLKEFPINKSVEVETSFLNLKDKRVLRHAIMLDEPFSKYTRINSLIKRDITLISKFNSLYELRSPGVYKTFNNINDFKKLLFFFTFLKKNLIINGKR
jgi:hypothetical protein